MEIKDVGGSRRELEPSWIGSKVALRDRGEHTFKNHVEIARECLVSSEWLEERLKEASIEGFELEDGSWVTTKRGVWTYLERDPPETPREIVGSWADVQRIAPGDFSIRPRISRTGNCIFMYFADDEAWADRVDDFLTIYRSLQRPRIVGFKLKNVTILTARLGDLWVEFQTSEFRVYMLVQMVLQASLKSPTFDHDALPKYHDMFEMTGSMTAPPIPAFAH